MVIIAGVYRVSGRTLPSKKFKSYIVSSHKYEAVICDNFYKNKVTLNIYNTVSLFIPQVLSWHSRCSASLSIIVCRY